MTMQPSLAARALSSTRLFSWIFRGGTAVTEQALFAGGNFALNVALARSLPPTDYGAFAFTATLLIILTGVYNAFILEPATVLEPSRYERHLGRYWRAQLTLHLAFTICLGGVLGAAGLFSNATATATASTIATVRASDSIGSTLIAAGVFVPAIYLFWLARRFLYVLGRPLTALTGSALYIGGIGVGLVAGVRLHILTPSVGFAIMGCASLAAAVFMLVCVARLVPATTTTGDLPPFTMRTLAIERWRYGRWLLATVCLETAIAPAVTFIATATLGLAAVGTLRAMQTFVAPLGHGMSALSSLALPALAQDFGRERLASLQKKSQMILGLLISMGLVIELVLVLGHQPLEHLFYGGKYAFASVLIPVFGLAALFEGTAATYTMVLSAVQRPRLLLMGSAISAPIGLAIAIVCIYSWGMYGAAVAFALTSAISTLVRRSLARPWLAPRHESLALDPTIERGESRASS